ncbi:MAG: rRNA pseudouridine synthase [Deltaproteobacteria bacterium]|nr:rRNA pseudouridine synthase [Deltaproteobacteria bacterium]
MSEQVRLQRYLASAGVAARRKAEELILAGRVKVNGQVVKVLGTKVDPDRDDVQVDDEAVVALDNFYVLLNKPKACITAVTDDRGRPTVMDYLPNLPVPVKPVGRLDFYTEGVLLLTNDGELAARLLAPAGGIPKTYHAKVHGRLTPRDVSALRQGIQLDDGTMTMPAEVEVLPSESKHMWLGITIHEGKHRQIHRMLEALGHRVDKLQRVAFANLTFHDLRIGDARELTQLELNELRDLAGLDHSAVARGTWRAMREDTDSARRARAKLRAETEGARAGEGDLDERMPHDDELDDIESEDAAYEDEAPEASNHRGYFLGASSGDEGGGADEGDSGDVGPDGRPLYRGRTERAPRPTGYRAERGPRPTGFRRDASTVAPRSAGPGPRGAGPRGAGPRGAGPRGAGPRGAGPRGAGPGGPRGAGPRGAGPRDAGPRGAGPRGAGPGGPRGAGPRGAGPRGAGPRGAGPRDAGPRGAGYGGPRSAGPGARAPGPRGAGPRGAGYGPRGAGPRDAGPGAGPRGAGPRGAGPGPRGAGFGGPRGAAPRGAGGPGPRGAGPRGAGGYGGDRGGPRGGGSRGPRSGGNEGGGQRSTGYGSTRTKPSRGGRR